MILLLPLHRPKQVYDFQKKMIPKMKQHIYNAVYPDSVTKEETIAINRDQVNKEKCKLSHDIHVVSLYMQS